MLTTKEVILAKIESTYGVDPTPAAATDAIWAKPIELNPNMQERVRELLSNSISKPNSIIAPQPIDFTITTELKSHGHANDGLVATPIEIDPLLRACGLSVTYNIAVSIVYQVISSSFESVTCWAYLDGIIHKILGCRGNLEIVIENNQIAMANFKMRGLWSSPVDGAIVTPTVDSNNPVKVGGATCTIGGYAAVNKGVQIDLGNVLSSREDVTKANGISEIAITDRNPKGSFEPEVVAEATNSYWADLLANTEQALLFSWGSAGNIVQIDAPKLQYLSHGWGERENHRIYNTAFKLNENAGDDEFVLTFK